MAGRRPLQIGELGSVTFSEARGRIVGRARTRGAGGIIHRLAATAATREEALEQLKAAASDYALTVEVTSLSTTMTSLLDLWIEDRAGPR